MDSKLKLYWAEWRNAARVLNQTQGLDPADLESERQAIHQRELGGTPSSKEIVKNNRQFDKVIAAFRAISQPAAIAPQLDALDQQKRRIIWVIDQELARLQADRNYLAGLLRRMSSEDKIPYHQDLTRYTFEDLQRITRALQRTRRARERSRQT